MSGREWWKAHALPSMSQRFGTPWGRDQAQVFSHSSVLNHMSWQDILRPTCPCLVLCLMVGSFHPESLCIPDVARLLGRLTKDSGGSAHTSEPSLPSNMGVLARCGWLRNGLEAEGGEPGMTSCMNLVLISATISVPINIRMIPATNFSLKEAARVN